MPHSRVTTTSVTDPRYPLFSSYLHCFDSVACLYDYSPYDPAGYGERARELATQDHDRETLAAVLEDYNASLGAPPETLSAARSIAREGSVVVIAGQQPGVLTGPLYTFWKALATVQLARAAAQHLPPGTVVVPVFWIGAEDHDLDEVAPVTVWGPNATLTRLTYEPGTSHGPRTSVGFLPTGGAALRLVEAFERALGKVQFKEEVSDLLRRTADEADNLGDWFGRLLLALLGREGLVVINPLLPGIRALQAPAFTRMIRENEALAQAFFEGCERVRSLGFEPQVDKDPDAANLYLYRGNERVPLFRRDGGGFTAGRGEAVPVSEPELIDTARSRPRLLSPNVVFRPLSQDTVLPVLAYVGGPGETSYFGLYRELYHRFGRRLPIIYPRPNVTLIEPSVARHLKKCGLSAGEALDLERLRAEKASYLEEADPVGIDEAFDRAAGAVRRAYAGPEGLAPLVGGIDPYLKTLAAGNLERVLSELEWLRKKTWQRHRRACREVLDRYEAIEGALRPRGDYQERVLNIFSFLARYGPGLTRELAAIELVAPDASLDPGHRLVRI